MSYFQVFPFTYEVSCLGRNPPRAISKTPSQLVVVPLWLEADEVPHLFEGNISFIYADKVAKTLSIGRLKILCVGICVSSKFTFIIIGKGFPVSQKTSLVHLLPKHCLGASPSPLDCVDTKRHLIKKPRQYHFHAKCGSSGSPVTRGVLWASRDWAVPRDDLPLVLWCGWRKVCTLLLRRLWWEPEQLWLGGILHGSLWQHQ